MGGKKQTNTFPSLRECHFFPARTITNKLKLIKRLLAIAVTLSLNSTLSMKFKLGETGVKHFTLFSRITTLGIKIASLENKKIVQGYY